MNLKNKLKHLNKESLLQLVMKLHGIHATIDDIIERHLAAVAITAASADTAVAHQDDHQALFETVQRQIEQLALESQFVGYYESYRFSCRLESILIDINTLVRECDPNQALMLTEQFLDSTEAVMNRCDDSDGDIGNVYQVAIDQWLDIAGEVRAIDPDACDWIGKIKTLFDNNDYGLFDDVIAHSRNVLTGEELQLLARQYQTALKLALEQSVESYNHDASQASLGMRAVAEATDDMSLFEQSTLLISPQPNTRQLEIIIDFALSIKDFERAEYWLQQPQWQTDQYRQKDLGNKLLETCGDIDGLKQNLLADFNEQPNTNHLDDIWQLSDAAEKARLEQDVLNVVSERQHDESNIPDSIAMLLAIKAVDQAETLLLAHHQHLHFIGYGTLLDWLEHYFNGHQYLLAQVICYRCLLTDLLDRGYSKAYHHGGNYFNALLELDKQISDYQNLDNAQTFIRTLQQKHWRKRSFWAEANYPNKP